MREGPNGPLSMEWRSARAIYYQQRTLDYDSGLGGYMYLNVFKCI